MRSFILILALSGVPALLADTDDYVRRSVPIDPAARLTLRADLGAINVRPGATRSVEIEVYFRGSPRSRAEFDRMLRDFSLDVSQQASGIRVEGRFKSGWRDGSFRSFWSFFNHSTSLCNNGKCLEYAWLRQMEYRISLPRDASVDLTTARGSIAVGDLKGEVAARTSGGNLSFGRIEGPVSGNTSGGNISLEGGRGKAVLHTSGGSIRIEDVDGDVNAATSGGSVQINRAAGRVSAHTSGGSITIRESTGAVEASTSGGSVSAFLSRQPSGDSRLSTSGGSINVQLSGDMHMDLDAATSGGSVSCDFPVSVAGERNSLRAPINGGGPLLHLRTSGGGIHVGRR